MKVDLNGKVAIVTGGGGAIGTAMCLQLAANGAKVVAAGRTLKTLQATVDAVKAAGGEASAVVCDVSKKESVDQLIAETVRIYGRLDCMVNNAGINGGPQYRKPIHQYDDDLWDRIVSIDLNGVYYCSKAAAKQMLAQGEGGSIINIGSIVGQTPLRLQCAFTAAKAGVFNLTRTMALELAPHGIRVNGIAPGSIMFEGTRELFYANPETAAAITSHFPIGTPGEPDDIAAATCYLASEDAKFVVGAIMTVDGGWICGYNRDL
ncbi:MAG: SDR family oxidoreductase [Clostridia bacterium]|nr:SDR family oxidoreductase [Clostridia bacterium]MBP3652298.1 SDR family oxidoreductase [Clostridia bacterium]